MWWEMDTTVHLVSILELNVAMVRPRMERRHQRMPRLVFVVQVTMVMRLLLVEIVHSVVAIATLSQVLPTPELLQIVCAMLAITLSRWDGHVKTRLLLRVTAILLCCTMEIR